MKLHLASGFECLAPVVLTIAFTSAFAAGDDATLQLSLTPGTRIRIQAPEVFPGKVVGTVNALSADSLTIQVPGRSEPVSVLRDKIARLEVSDGPRSRGVDAAIGAGIGAGIGAVGGAVADSGKGQSNCGPRRGRGRFRIARDGSRGTDRGGNSTRRTLEADFGGPLPGDFCARTRPWARLGNCMEVLNAPAFALQ
jgi:hypothetical protein